MLCGGGDPNFRKEGKFSIDVTIIIFIFEREQKHSTTSFLENSFLKGRKFNYTYISLNFLEIILIIK